MEEYKFKVEDRVLFEGEEWKVVGVYNDPISLMVIQKPHDGWISDENHSSSGVPMGTKNCWHVYPKEVKLIEPSDPPRYTGELREGMRVWMESREIESREAIIKKDVDGHDWVAKDDTSYGYWSLKRNEKGEWWGGKYAYVSRVISEPEEKKPAESSSFAEGFKQLAEWMKNGGPAFCLGNEEDADRVMRPYPMHIGADGFAVPVPIMGHIDCKLSIKNSPHKGGIQTFMEGLKSIPAKIKRILNPNYRAFYQLGWVDEELDLTAKGQFELINMLLDKHETELGDLAKKEVARRKKHVGQDEE